MCSKRFDISLFCLFKNDTFSGVVLMCGAEVGKTWHHPKTKWDNFQKLPFSGATCQLPKSSMILENLHPRSFCKSSVAGRAEIFQTRTGGPRFMHLLWSKLAFLRSVVKTTSESLNVLCCTLHLKFAYYFATF